MSEPLQNNTKEIYSSSLNNYSSDLSKNPIPISNINTNNNINSNSFSQENIFNELICATNCQESKNNNSSFYNFSESTHSNPDNQNIIMNKDQLYQTFILFQKFLNQNLGNNTNSINSNSISPNKMENQSKFKLTYKNNFKDNNVIDEINELEDNDNENSANIDQSNGKISFKKNRTTQNWKKCDIKIDEEENHKELIESKSNYNVINGNDILNNGGNDNIIFFDEKQNNDIVYKDDKDIILKLNNSRENNKNYSQRNNSDDINNRQTKKSYDEIPIKFNKVNFIDLVEKKLEDEKKYGYKGVNESNKIKFEQKIKNKKENENISQNQYNINYSKKIKNKIKNENKENSDKEKKCDNSERDRERDKIITITNNKNISNNYSFDRDETKILSENKNIFENSSLIDNLNNIITKSDKKQNKNENKKNNNTNIIISKEKLAQLINNLRESKIKEYKIDKIQLCINNNNNIIKKTENKIETENNDINKIDEKEQLLEQKIKELNKEMVKLKEERNKVSKIKLEYEKSMNKLNNDLYQFGQKRDEFEKYRKNEINKIKNDKKNNFIESKNLKDIKNQNQALILKTKKDKEIIDNLKSKISELQSIIKQKENNNLTGSFNTNTFKYNKKRCNTNKNNNLAELDVDCINTNQIIDGYFANTKNNSIRSMTNIKNLFCSTIDDKIKNRDTENQGLETYKELQDKNLAIKRNNSSNKNYTSLPNKIEVIKNEEKNTNSKSLTVNNLYNYMSEPKTSKNISINESVERSSLSKKFLERTEKNIKGKEILNERLIFSPQASRTSVGFGLKKISIKINNTPKENMKITKKIYENKKPTKKNNTYAKALTNNLTGSINNNANINTINDSNQNSYSNSTATNNNKSNNNKKIAKEKTNKKTNTNNDLSNNNKINKKVPQKQKKNNDIFSSKSKNNLMNKNIKLKKNQTDNGSNLNNSTNTTKKMKPFNNKMINQESISRNLSLKNNNNMKLTDNLINMKGYIYLKNKNTDNKISEEYDFSIPKKYLNKEYKLIKSLKTDDKIINLYTNDKKEIIFKSGVRKEIYQDGHQIIYFANGDLKQIYPDGKSCYFFQETKTVQITLNNGMEIYKFENNQIEKHYPDGTKQILFSDGSERYIYNDGTEETYFSDGKVQKIDKKRNVIVEKMKDDENA